LEYGGKKFPYHHNPENYLYLDENRKLGIVKRIRKQVSKFNLKLEDLYLSIALFSITYKNIN